MAKKSKKRMRLPNGIGSVHLIGDSKRRRKPWRARVPSHIEFNEDTGKATQKYITLGYYETETEAIEALFDYRKNPYTIEASAATFNDIFEMWKVKKFPELSKSSTQVYLAAYKNSLSLHNMKMRDIRTLHLEKAMNDVKGGYQTQVAMKNLWGQLFKYAMEHDIVEKNYNDFVKTKDKAEGTKRTAIPAEDIEKIWKAIDEGDEDAEIVMMYIYTGFRASELLEIKKENIDLEKRIMIGGKKTAAGKDRRVPIHKCILPFIEKRMQGEGEYLITGQGKSKNKPIGRHAFTYNHWNKLMERIGLKDITAHYARHTFATMLRVAGVEEDIRKLILGHSTQDVTDRYTHHPDEMLTEAIDKVNGRE